MTVGQLMKSVGLNAPDSISTLPVDVDDILNWNVEDVSIDEAIKRVGQLFGLSKATGLLRAKYMRRIRDAKFGITGTSANGGDINSRMGWADFCRQTWEAKVGDCNAEIEGLGALERAKHALSAVEIDDSAERPAVAPETPQITSTMLQEIARGGKEHAEKVATDVLTGKIPATKRGVRAAVKEEKEKAKTPSQTVEKAQPRPASELPKPSSLPIAPPTSSVPVYSLRKWKAQPVVSNELDFYQAEVEKARKAAVSYRNSIKRLGDRLDASYAKDRHWAEVMTMLAQIWATDHDFDFDAELQLSQDALREGSEQFKLMWQRCHAKVQIVD